MIYGPRNDHELDIVTGIVEASHAFASKPTVSGNSKVTRDGKFD